LDHSVEGEHVYANPDFELILKNIAHFLEGQRKAPERTLGTILLPVWMWATFWKLLQGAKVLAYIPPGEHLFTSLEWRTGGVGAKPQGRAARGATRWSGVDPFSAILRWTTGIGARWQHAIESAHHQLMRRVDSSHTGSGTCRHCKETLTRTSCF
jgi:hypothetical protein